MSNDYTVKKDEDLVPQEERGAYRAFQRGFRRNYLYILGILFVLLLVSFVGVYFFSNKLALSQHPLVQRMIPTYHAVRKLPDVLFFPYFFSPTKLDVLSLQIKVDDQRKLNKSLPDNPFGTESLSNRERVFVPALFSSGEYSDEVTVRYRGSLGDHWNSYQKSYQIDYPKNNLFKGWSEGDAIIASNRLYFSPTLTDYRAKRFGLATSDAEHVWLEINGVDHGVYLWLEQWSKEWVEKRAVSDSSILFGLKTDEGLAQNAMVWKTWTHDDSALRLIDVMQQIVNNTTDEDFEKLAPVIFDIEKILGMSVVNVLSQSYHNHGNNLVLMYNASTGLFEIVPNHTGIFAGHYGEPHYFLKRIHSIDSFQERLSSMFNEYALEHKADDLEFVAEWLKRMKPEFYRDNAILENNFTTKGNLEELERIVAANYEDPSDMLNFEYTVDPPVETSLDLPAQYSFILDVVKTPAEFVKSNPQFYVVGDDLHLGPGVVNVNKDIVVPAGGRMVVAPGTTLRLGKNNSIFSFRPIDMVGSKLKPIRVEARNKEESWGVLAIMNADEESVVKEVYISDGSEDTIGDVLVTGMLAAHGSSLRVEQSQLSNAGGDDALNVKHGKAVVIDNIFKENSSDGMDLDFVTEDSIVQGNTFESNIGFGGDAIDLSWSNLTVSNNNIFECGDKGVSVGESSKPKIVGNIILGCNIGVASKDSSAAVIAENIFINNFVAVSAYQKKEVFSGGTAMLDSNVFYGNDNLIEADDVSSVVAESNIELDDLDELASRVPQFVIEKLN